MLGWRLIISTHEATDQPGFVPVDTILATWRTSIGGLDWVDQLVKEGKATQLRHGGYPNRYAISASVVRPLIENGPPSHSAPLVIGDDYVSVGGWSDQITRHAERWAAVTPDQTLCIEAWDQS